MELLFEIESKNNNVITEWIDDRMEDNSYSYSINLPEKINLLILYDNPDNQRKIDSI